MVCTGVKQLPLRELQAAVREGGSPFSAAALLTPLRGEMLRSEIEDISPACRGWTYRTGWGMSARRRWCCMGGRWRRSTGRCKKAGAFNPRLSSCVPRRPAGCSLQGSSPAARWLYAPVFLPLSRSMASCTARKIKALTDSPHASAWARITSLFPFLTTKQIRSYAFAV